MNFYSHICYPVPLFAYLYLTFFEFVCLYISLTLRSTTWSVDYCKLIAIISLYIVLAGQPQIITCDSQLIVEPTPLNLAWADQTEDQILQGKVGYFPGQVLRCYRPHRTK